MSALSLTEECERGPDGVICGEHNMKCDAMLFSCCVALSRYSVKVLLMCVMWCVSLMSVIHFSGGGPCGKLGH